MNAWEALTIIAGIICFVYLVLGFSRHAVEVKLARINDDYNHRKLDNAPAQREHDRYMRELHIKELELERGCKTTAS